MAEDSSSDFEGITWPDYLVIVAYFLFVLAVGLYVSQAHLRERDAISEFILIALRGSPANFGGKAAVQPCCIQIFQ